MTEDELIARLTTLAKDAKEGDEHDAHVEADTLLCDFLHERGYHKVTPAFDAISKWYA